MISLILAYIVIALISITLFRTAVMYIQEGSLYDEDKIMTVIGGIFWPLSYPVILLFVVGTYSYEGIVKLSDYLYKKIKKGDQ